MDTSQARSKPKTTDKSKKAQRVSQPADRHRMIAEAAYYNAEQRGFAEGGEVDDWLLAEKQIGKVL